VLCRRNLRLTRPPTCRGPARGRATTRSPRWPRLRLLRRPGRDGGRGAGARHAGGALPRRAQPTDRRGLLLLGGGTRCGPGARGAGRPAPGPGDPRSRARRPGPARLPDAPLDPDRARARPADRRLEVLPGHPAGPGVRGPEPVAVPVAGPGERPVRPWLRGPRWMLRWRTTPRPGSRCSSAAAASPWPGRSSSSTPSATPCTPRNGNARSPSSGC
jgi:hypothetical protein